MCRRTPIPSNGMAGLQAAVSGILNMELPVADWAKEEGIADEELKARILKAADESAAARAARFGPDIMRQVEKAVLMQTLDHLWREHIVTLDHLRQVVGLRGYAQRDPLVEYKAEGFQLFEVMTKPPAEPSLPMMEAHHFDPLTGEDEMAIANASLSPSEVRIGESATM